MAPLSSLVRKNKNGEWKETCIGIWSRSIRYTDKPTELKPPLCMGINLVQVKNLDLNTVQPTNTLGLQIIIQDTEVADTQDKNTNLQKGKTVWEQDSSSFDHLLTNLKQKTQQWSNAVKDIITSPKRKEIIAKSINEGYTQLREWTDKFWK